MPRATMALFAAAMLLAFAAPAQAERRVALVIGNGAYTATTRLANPPNDAADMATALGGLGFEVVEVVNGDLATMTAAIRRFGKLSAGADVALFYYAGHGLQVGSTNYMLPISAVLASEQDLEFEAIEVGLPLRLMDQLRAKVKLVVLDACRNNPLAQTLASSMRAAGRGAAVGRGLARIDGAEGTLMAFATAPGATAEDGEARNSPFTRALLDNIGTPGLEVSLLFRRVRADVMAATGDQQVPWVSEALLGEFYFAPAATGADTAREPRPSAPGPAQSAEIVFWNAIEDSTGWADFQAYLDTYGDEGAFAALARVRRNRLREPEAAALPPAPEPEPPAVAAMEVPYRVVTRANLRAGPSTDDARVGTLEPGAEVMVTGKVEGRNWYRVTSPAGLEGFVHGSLIQAEHAYRAASEMAEPAAAPVSGGEVAALEATADPAGEQVTTAAPTGFDGRWAGELVTTDGTCRGAIPVELVVAGTTATARLDSACTLEGNVSPRGEALIVGLCRPRHYRIKAELSAGGVAGSWTSMTGEVSSAASAPAPRDCLGRIEVERVDG